MNKKLVYGMIALLSVSFLILGCSTGTSNDSSTVNPPSPTPPGTTGASGTSAPTKAELAANAASALEDGTRTGTVTVTPNPADGSVTIGGSGTLTIDSLKIDSGVKIVVASTATLVVEGDITNDGTIEVAGTYTLAEDATVTNNGTITIGTGAEFEVEGTIANSGTIAVTGVSTTFTLAAGAAATNTGTIAIGTGAEFKLTKEDTGGGTTIPAASFTNGGTINVSGTDSKYTLEDGVTGINEGTVTVGPGATVAAGVGVNFTGNGKNIVSAGGTAIVNGVSAPFVGPSGGGTTPHFELTSGTFSYNNNEYILAGVATVKNHDSSLYAVLYLQKDIDTTDSTYTQTLTIARGGKLTIQAGQYISLRGSRDFDSTPLKGDLLSGTGDAPQIVIGDNQAYYRDYSTTPFYPNFYMKSDYSSAVASDGEIEPKTYIWVADNNGPGDNGTVPGWVEQ
ncbi:hypothetical protein LQZ21_07755 [Treponema sp. TIM-1]|uniref:hypothetical protein n=1 Tax=Treponema sp. TIM-1 TaxID=2898417 RepID=UPI00397EF832